MKRYNYSDQSIPGFEPLSRIDKKSLLAGSIVLIFNNELEFIEKCKNLTTRISGVVLYLNFPQEISITNNLLIFLPITFVTGQAMEDGFSVLDSLIKSAEEKRTLSSMYKVKCEEQIITQNALNFVTRNYYEMAKTLEFNSQLHLKRRDAILAISNKFARVAGFQINVESNTITLSDDFYQIFNHHQNISLSLETGISSFPSGVNQVMLDDIRTCTKTGESIYREFCTNKEKNQWYAVQIEKLDNVGSSTIFGVLQNISIRKQLEAESEEQKKKAIITSKLAALGEMSGGIAHEINTPLSVLLLQITRMERILKKKALLNGDIQDCTNHLKSTIEKIAIIIRGMKLLCRGGEVCELEPSNLNKIIKEVTAVCMPKLKELDIRLELIDASNCGKTEFLLPEVQISQILINLINNSKDAVEHLNEKWIRIILNVQDLFLKISVIDSGKGIPKEIQENIFNPFFTTKETGKGTGLGLSLSKSLAKNFNGELLMINNSEHTRFDLRIPVVKP